MSYSLGAATVTNGGSVKRTSVPTREVQLLLRKAGFCVALDGRWGPETSSTLDEAAALWGYATPAAVGSSGAASVQLSTGLKSALSMKGAERDDECPSARRSSTSPAPVTPDDAPIVPPTDGGGGPLGVPVWAWVGGAAALAGFGVWQLRKKKVRPNRRRRRTR